jgi:hypothetical protein
MNLENKSFVLYCYDDGVLAASRNKNLLEGYRVKYLSYNMSVSDPYFEECLSELVIYEVPEITE